MESNTPYNSPTWVVPKKRMLLIFSTSLTENLNSLKLVFLKLGEANLKLQLDKWEFLKKEACFLGHIVTPNGTKLNPLKTKAIISYPIPK